MCLCVKTTENRKCLCVESAGKCESVCVESATKATHKATHNHAERLSLGCSFAIALSLGRSVATLLSRPVGFPPSAGTHQRGQSLRGHRCTPRKGRNIHCKPCGAFVVRKSFMMLLGQQQFHPTQQPPQQASVTLNSPQPKASPPSLPRSSVLAFAPLPAFPLRSICGQWAWLRAFVSRCGREVRLSSVGFLACCGGCCVGCSCCCFTNVKAKSLQV